MIDWCHYSKLFSTPLYVIHSLTWHSHNSEYKYSINYTVANLTIQTTKADQKLNQPDKALQDTTSQAEGKPYSNR